MACNSLKLKIKTKGTRTEAKKSAEMQEYLRYDSFVIPYSLKKFSLPTVF